MNDGIASEAIWPCSGIAAGSASATFELTVLLLPALAKLEIVDPQACISLHVDDIGITVMDPNRLTALSRFEHILRIARGEFAKLKLPLAREKGVVIASSKELAEKANVMVETLQLQQAPMPDGWEWTTSQGGPRGP